MEIYPGIWRIALPVSEMVEQVHSYLIKGNDSTLLIDAGWDSDVGWERLLAGLEAAGIAAGRDSIDQLLITHEHPDHMGMAHRVKEVFNSRIMMHRSERVYLQPRYGDPAMLLSQMTEWLRANGVPADTLASIRDASLALTGRELPTIDRHLDGGEVIRVGDFVWEVLWTPGHAVGHVCLYEPRHQILMSGDQVLPRESSNISLHPQSSPNPLADYLDSLHYLQKLPVKQVIPSHGDPFTDLKGRIDHLIRRHVEKAAEVERALQTGAKTGWEAAHHVSWKGGRVPFPELNFWAQRIAVTETLAHLEWIRAEGATRKDFSTGVIKYYKDQPDRPGPPANS